jgi:hypothetical protein
LLARKKLADEIAALNVLWALKDCKDGGKCRLDIGRLTE